MAADHKQLRLLGSIDQPTRRIIDFDCAMDCHLGIALVPTRQPFSEDRLFLG
ncbi:MAG: hypothetical protein K2X97_22220 [Mycobacteriaceae bacterium]|nr:hypothetical protein [Mycobacteriaceae bacterium]